MSMGGTETNEFIWVDSQQQLDQLLDWAAQQSLLAIDTEFTRVSTFYAKPALIQLGNGEDHWLVDCVALGVNWLKALFESEILFIGHALGEDLELFAAQLQQLPVNFVDTQIGHSLATGDHLMGYANLVELREQVLLDKSQVRSDWMQRPLSTKQLSYAVDDIRYLIAIYHQIDEELKAKNRRDWWPQESLRQSFVAHRTQVPEAWLERVAARTDLKGVNWPLLARLVLWREHEIRERDLPRSRVVKDAELVQIARVKPVERWQLARIKGLSSGAIARYSEQWFELVEHSSGDDSKSPKRLAINKEKAAKKIIREVADQLGIPSEIVGSSRDLQRFYGLVVSSDYNEGGYSPFASGWRNEYVTPKLKLLFSEGAT